MSSRLPSRDYYMRPSVRADLFRESVAAGGERATTVLTRDSVIARLSDISEAEPGGIVNDPENPPLIFFGEFLKTSTVAAYADKYIQYESLKLMLQYMRSNRLKLKDMFYKKLETNYVFTKTFAAEWLNKLENLRDTEITHPDDATEQNATVKSALELNRFVFINQEALTKLVKKHDKFFSQSRLIDAWEWKLDFGFTQRIIDVILRSAAIKIRIKEREQLIEVEKKELIKTEGIVKPEKRISFGVHVPPAEPAGSGDVELGKIETKNPLFANNESAPKPPAPAHPPTLTKQTDSFVRESTKYWVMPYDLAQVTNTFII